MALQLNRFSFDRKGPVSRERLELETQAVAHVRHRMSRDERESWQELHHLQLLRLIAVVAGAVGLAACITLFSQSLTAGFAAVFAAPIAVLLVVLAVDRIALHRD